jgi:hypothetical protein
MNIRTRLAKLESAKITEKKPIRIGRFTVVPGNHDPMGYSCGDVMIIREPGETTEDLKNRCFDTVNWPDCNHSHIFDSLEQ